MQSLGQVARIFISIIIIGFTYLNVNGQSINEMRKLWKNDNLSFFSDIKKDKLFSNADLSKYAGTRDGEFAAYLKEGWHDYSIFPGFVDVTTHPKEQPIFDESGLDMNPPVSLPFSNINGKNDHLNGYIGVLPRIRKIESYPFNSQKSVFRFYGQPITINFDKMLKLSKINALSEDSISVFWESFARSNSNQLIDQLMVYRDLLGMGDWGYFQLVKTFSKHISNGDPLNSDLLTWALMIRSGFDVRLAFNQHSTSVLFSSENTIYSKQFVIIGQKRFYLDREMKSQLLITSENSFPDNVGMIDLNFYKSLNFNGKLAVRQFSIQWNKKNYFFSIRYNPEVLRFYKEYPRTDPSVYFRAPVSSTMKEDLMVQFYPLLSKVDKSEAAAFLQQFVQKKIVYRSIYPPNQFYPSRFAEEILASKSGNDENKAVLLSLLVRILLQLPVVGVQFPDYFSAAICYDIPLDGNYYYLNREKYYITDPASINAPIGAILPEFKGLIPQLIDLSDNFSKPNSTLKIWKSALKLGANRGWNNQDVVFDKDGKTLITGYIAGKKSIYFPFIACFSEENSLQWIRKFEGDGNAISFAIAKGNNDEIFISGSFKGKIVMDGHELQSRSNKSDLFIAQFKKKGELVWMKKAKLDSASDDQSLTYLVKFDRSGENVSTILSNEDERNVKNGFVSNFGIDLCFAGSIAFLNSLIPFTSADSIKDISYDFNKEFSLLIGKKFNTKVSYTLALMKFIAKNGTEVTGKQLQTYIVRHYPTFQVNNASLFKTIGQIKKLKNDNGIVSLHTLGGKLISFSNLKLEDGARFNISFFGNGDVNIHIISGIQRSIGQMEWPLNSILIDSSSGDLIIDYDHDHTIKTVSLGIFLSK